MKMEESKIAEFYRDKNILVTGATGFVGKLLVEKLLRVCRPARLYFLIRPKRGVEPGERLNEIYKSPVFNKLKSAVGDYQERVVLVAGDMMLPGLGLAASDRDILVHTVQVVFHIAATVKFDEALPVATKINVIGTKLILELCRDMTKLESVVYVSTAFSNCPYDTIEEKFYDPPISSENLIKLTECLKDHQLAQVTPMVLEKWPNTYSFTKAIAEEVVRTHGKGLPVAVFRPAIMVSTKSDPVPGWIGNLYGPTGLMVGTGAGVLRVSRYDGKKKAEIVPADMTINSMLAVGYKNAAHRFDPEIPIYNFTTDEGNEITWKDYVEISMERGREIPSSRAVWYYMQINVSSAWTFVFLSLFLHNIPALLVDLVLIALNKKPMALNIYKKIHKFSGVLAYFSCRSWKFENNNINSLWKSLGEKDKELFDFDMAAIEWKPFVRSTVDGVREYLFEESMETLPYAKKKFYVLWMLHQTMKIIFFSCLLWYTWKFANFAKGIVMGS